MNLRSIERALGIPFGTLDDEKELQKPEVKALLNIIKSMPWIIDVADYGFDKEISDLILIRESNINQVQKEINRILEKRKKEPLKTQEKG